MCAAYGTVMLLYVMIGSTILSMGLWLMLYNIMWMFIGCGLRDIVPLVGSLSILVTVRVYTGQIFLDFKLSPYFDVVFFVLVRIPASEFYVSTFRNTLSFPSSLVVGFCFGI